MLKVLYVYYDTIIIAIFGILFLMTFVFSFFVAKYS
jgi:hypothetical protein